MINRLKTTFANKRIFITGHTGFKGTWMLAVLNYLGNNEVMGYALAADDGSMYNAIDGDSLCHSIIADIRDADRLTEEISRFQPDYIIHLAAQALVIDAYQFPAYTWDVNVMGTVNVMNAIKLSGHNCYAVLVTTDKVYENKEWYYPYRENDTLGGHDPYASSKAAAELAVSSFRRSFFPIHEYAKHQQAIASARAGNVIGGGDWSANRLVPDIARALLSEGSVVVRNPNSVRPWQHVLEPVCAYLLLASQLGQDPKLHSQAYNIGPNQEDVLSVEELVNKCLMAWGGGTYTNLPNASAVHEANLLQLDISLAKNLLNWQPKWNSAKAIEMTIDWYKNHLNQQFALTLAQVDEYLSSE
ncbi:MAG: CDP-glucose 4,6-dehydratase [Bacteroidota bacterium]|nr:CDP-glucose 4,6-dehydratase [Bacteroidota bacterium]